MANYNNLSDNQLVALIQDTNDQKAIDTFYIRNQKRILKSIKNLVREIPYDLSFSPDELFDDAINESYLAINDAIQKFDFKSSSIHTLIENKIRWHLLDLQRKNAKRREVLLSSLDSEKDEDNIENYEYLEAEQDNELFRNQQHKAEILSALRQAKKQFYKEPEKAKLFDALYTVYQNDAEKPIPAVAKLIGKRRESAYNHIKEAILDLPQKLAREIISILNDN